MNIDEETNDDVDDNNSNNPVNVYPAPGVNNITNGDNNVNNNDRTVRTDEDYVDRYPIGRPRRRRRNAHEYIENKGKLK